MTVLPPDSAKSVPKVATAVGFENPTVVLNTTVRDHEGRACAQGLEPERSTRTRSRRACSQATRPWRVPAALPVVLRVQRCAQAVRVRPDPSKSLLKAAGADGKTVKLISSDVFTNGPQLAQVIASYWTAVGLKVNMQMPQFNGLSEGSFAKGANHPDAVYVSTSSDLLDASSASRQLTTDGVQSAYANPTVDKLFTQRRGLPIRRSGRDLLYLGSEDGLQRRRAGRPHHSQGHLRNVEEPAVDAEVRRFAAVRDDEAEVGPCRQVTSEVLRQAGPLRVRGGVRGGDDGIRRHPPPFRSGAEDAAALGVASAVRHLPPAARA